MNGVARTVQAILPYLNQPPAGFPFRIKLLQVALGKRIQRNFSGLRDDVLADPILVTEPRVQSKLGLAIAKNIIELHGGKYSIFTIKSGAAFTFTI